MDKERKSFEEKSTAEGERTVNWRREFLFWRFCRAMRKESWRGIVQPYNLYGRAMQSYTPNRQRTKVQEKEDKIDNECQLNIIDNYQVV